MTRIYYFMITLLQKFKSIRRQRIVNQLSKEDSQGPQTPLALSELIGSSRDKSAVEEKGEEVDSEHKNSSPAACDSAGEFKTSDITSVL